MGNYRRMRTEVFNKMRAVDNALDESDDMEESEDSQAEANLSENFSSSDEDIEMFDYDNDITQGIWLPNEPKLYVIYDGKKFVSYDDEGDMMNRHEDSDGGSASDHEGEIFHIENHKTHSEYMTMKELHSFKQETLCSNAIYMLDFESEVFVWVGSKVPKEKSVQCSKYVGHCV